MWIRAHDGTIVNLANATRVGMGTGFGHGAELNRQVAARFTEGPTVATVALFKGTREECKAYLARLAIDLAGPEDSASPTPGAESQAAPEPEATAS